MYFVFGERWFRMANFSPTNEAASGTSIRIGLRPAFQDRRRTPVRGVQPTLRARLNPGHQQSAIRRVDRGVRLRAPDRGAARPPHPPCPYPGNERRQLPAQPEPKKAEIPPKNLTGFNHRGHGCPGGSTGTSHAASLRAGAKRYAKQRGSLLWTTGTTRNTSYGITSSGPILLRPLDQSCSAVDRYCRRTGT